MSGSVSDDGDLLFRWAQRAADELNARRAEINALNVFPVPDSDTGSNMAHTMESAFRAASASKEERIASTVAHALASGAVRGARGNSGVVLSQVLRGIAHAVGTHPLDGQTLAHSLKNAVELVDAAIADPVEGTVVTVLRAAANASAQAAQRSSDLATVTDATVEAARTALELTPSQLPELRAAGVVDAGGAGLVVLLESLQAEIPASSGAAGSTDSGSGAMSHAGAAFYLEVMFYLLAEEETLGSFEEWLAERGDSLMLARDDHGATVHIHTHQAGEVIEQAFALGQVSDLRIESLSDAPAAEPTSAASERMLIAVTPPGAVAQLYRQAGATVVEMRDESDLAAQVVAVIEEAPAKEFIILPNGLLTREELTDIDRQTQSVTHPIALLPTTRLVAGIASLGMHDPGEPLATAAYTMSEAAHAMRVAVARVAHKASLTPAGPCAAGDIVVSSKNEIIAVGDDLASAVTAACQSMLEVAGEQVTILATTELDRAVLEKQLGVEVMFFDGQGIDTLGIVAEIGIE
ncbi:DAK2 domain-containing protein [Corynebacterium tapiri]|uniref:DAK2 domain-containing protein n=1 Tax=Corynebacterium tapiri TaxID=1448266 RepID=A0A5C4U6D4_9CORY|nr:DAK2 domain-containing protein [Corynebacterium tapiri]TNL99818.1 DAK2 domain-containing protein [Corynebacterium tapiri]